METLTIIIIISEAKDYILFRILYLWFAVYCNPDTWIIKMFLNSIQR